jgi:large subunit ribosomal protein L29
MKYKEIQEISTAEINAKVLELKQELAKERARISSGTRSENPGKIRKLRRDIARMFTELNKRTEDGK